MNITEIKNHFPENWEHNETAIGYCYVTYCSVTEQFYIGKKQSAKFADTYYGSGTSVKAWKYFQYELEHWPISWSDNPQELLVQERTWIRQARHLEGSANILPSNSPSMLGRKHSPETIQKMRESAKQRTHQPMSQATKDKISAANKGKHSMTPEQRKAVGDFHRGRKRSAETCTKIDASKSGENSPLYGVIVQMKPNEKSANHKRAENLHPNIGQSHLRYLIKIQGG